IVRPFLSVNSPMCDEVRALAKGFPTFAARVTSSSSEDSLVLNK
ncbi:hypothetical protein DBR06_SOUSAS5310044, partial [Sousa chinensis]